MSLASISIVGNLVRDPEKVEFNDGRIKSSMVVAVNGFSRSSKEKTAEYYKVETWDRLARLSLDYLSKGSQVTVCGRLTIERWIDRDGKQRATPTVHASQLALPPRPRDSSSEKAVKQLPEQLPDDPPEHLPEQLPGPAEPSSLEEEATREFSATNIASEEEQACA